MTNPTIFENVHSDHERAFQPLPAEHATGAAPGSRQKLRVMIKRIASGQELFHPLDFSDGRNLG